MPLLLLTASALANAFVQILLLLASSSLFLFMLRRLQLLAFHQLLTGL